VALLLVGYSVCFLMVVLRLLGLPRTLRQRRSWGEYCDLPARGLLGSAGLGRLMGGSGGSAGVASSGGEFQTVRQGFVLLLFVLHGSFVF